MKQFTLKKNRKLHLLIIIALSFLIAALPHAGWTFYRELDHWIGNSFFKLRYTIKGKEKIERALSVFNITDDDVTHIPELRGTPSDRTIFSHIIDMLSRGGAKTVIFDLLFLKAGDEDSDRALVRSTREAGFVFYPVSFNSGRNWEIIDKELFKEILFLPAVSGNGFPEQADTMSPLIPGLVEAARGVGGIALAPDSDGISRRLPLIYSYKNRNEYIPSLVLQGICHFLNVTSGNIEVVWGKHIKLTGDKKVYRIPIDKKGCMIINYSGPWKDPLAGFSLESVLSYRDDDSRELKELFRNTLVFISDISSGQKDYSRGIFESDYPNSGIISNAINTILTENYLYEPGPASTILTSLIFAAVIWFAAVRFKSLHRLVLLFSFFLLYLITEVVLFIFFNQLPLLSLPLIGMFFSLLFFVIYEKNIKRLDTSFPQSGLKINEDACKKYRIAPEERNTLIVLLEGHTYGKAAQILGKNENTIKNQVSRIKDKVYGDKAHRATKDDVIQTFTSDSE